MGAVNNRLGRLAHSSNSRLDRSSNNTVSYLAEGGSTRQSGCERPPRDPAFLLLLQPLRRGGSPAMRQQKHGAAWRGRSGSGSEQRRREGEGLEGLRGGVDGAGPVRRRRANDSAPAAAPAKDDGGKG